MDLVTELPSGPQPPCLCIIGLAHLYAFALILLACSSFLTEHMVTYVFRFARTYAA